MKIQNILSEDFQAQVAANPAPKIKFSDLNTLQVRVLQRMADGILDVDNAKDNEYDIMSDLAELGLLDQAYELTKAGQKAVDIAKKLGGSAELINAKKKQQAMANFDKNAADIEPAALDTMDMDDSSVPEPDDEFEDEFEFDLNKNGRPSF